jgi:hypothetical protein
VIVHVSQLLNLMPTTPNSNSEDTGNTLGSRPRPPNSTYLLRVFFIISSLTLAFLVFNFLALGFQAGHLSLQVSTLRLQLFDLRVANTPFALRHPRHTTASTKQAPRALASSSAFRCSDISALRMPNAMLDSYSVWYAAIVMRISSRTRNNNNPRSAQLIVT